MTISPKQRKEALAYKIGSLLSQQEPRLLEQIIKRNSKNEFVKMMAVARDNNEFY